MRKLKLRDILASGAILAGTVALGVGSYTLHKIIHNTPEISINTSQTPEKIKERDLKAIREIIEINPSLENILTNYKIAVKSSPEFQRIAEKHKLTPEDIKNTGYLIHNENTCAGYKSGSEKLNIYTKDEE